MRREVHIKQVYRRWIDYSNYPEGQERLELVSAEEVSAAAAAELSKLHKLGSVCGVPIGNKLYRYYRLVA